MSLRDLLPASLQGIVQQGLLYAAFEDALLPEFLFPMTATPRPWQAGLGDEVSFTRTGLLTPQETPITGSDPTPDNYTIERYGMKMEQYGNSLDTNMLASSIALISKFLEDQQKLGINAGQSLNRITRKKLYGAYGGGRTWATTTAASATTHPVESVDGFTHVNVNGIPTPVSAANPLTVTVNGVANTVTGVNTTTKVLTFGTAVAVTAGHAVVAANAPTSLRPNARDTAFQLQAGDTATFALFADAVARMRRQNIPSIGGYYVAHIDPITERQLFTDASFMDSLTSAESSPVFGSLSIGRFAGIDWVRNNEIPSKTVNAREVHQSIVMGGDALIAGPYAEMGRLLSELNNVPTGMIEMIDAGVGMEVAHIIRGPQDRLQQVVSSSWSWIGDFAVPTDSLTGDSALYKRAVVVEHV